MKNKILIIYLPQEEFDSLIIKDKMFFNENYILASFELEKYKFAFVLTRETFGDNIGVQYDLLIEILEEHLKDKYQVVLAVQHVTNQENLKLPVLLTKENGGFTREIFHNKIKKFSEKYIKVNYCDCVRIIEDFEKEFSHPELETDFNSNKVKEENTEEPLPIKKEDLDKRQDEKIELEKIIKELRQEKISISEAVLVIYPLGSKDDRDIVVEYIDKNKLFVSIREYIGNNSKQYRTNTLKKIIDIFNDNVKVYIALHRLQDSVDIEEINSFVKTKKNITLYYCNFSRIDQYIGLVNAYKKIVNNTDVNHNYDSLKQTIKKIYDKETIAAAAYKCILLLLPLSIDLSVIKKLKNQEMAEYLYEIRDSAIKRESNSFDPFYFRRKLVNLRFFVSGNLEESKIDGIAPTMEESENLASLSISAELHYQLKNLCGYGDENSTIVKFFKNLDEQFASLKDTNIDNIGAFILEYFEKRDWDIKGEKIKSFNDWLLVLAKNINEVKNQLWRRQ